MARKTAAKPAPPAGPTFVQCEQGDDTWRAERCGLLTASNFHEIMAESDERAQRRRLLYRLAGERLSGEPSEEWSNRHMERGKRLEPVARARYEKVKKTAVERVGFIKNFEGLRHCGASPDGLIGFHKGLEIKTELPELLIPRFERGAGMPGEHRWQVQGNMHLTDRDEWDLMIFWPGLPDYIVSVRRDEKAIKLLDNEIQRFNHDLLTLVDKLKRMGVA